MIHTNCHDVTDLNVCEVVHWSARPDRGDYYSIKLRATITQRCLEEHTTSTWCFFTDSREIAEHWAGAHGVSIEEMVNEPVE